MLHRALLAHALLLASVGALPAPKDGAGTIPPALRDFKNGRPGFMGMTFNITKYAEMQARSQYLAKQLNQTMIATARYAKLANDKKLTGETHHRSGGLLASLQSTWNKMFPAKPKPTSGKVPTAQQNMAAAAKKAVPLPAVAPSKAAVKTTQATVNKLAPTAKPTAAPKPGAPKPSAAPLPTG